MASFVGTSHYATVTTIVGAIAGLLGSVYGAEVANAFPLSFRAPWHGYSLHAAAFWVSLIIFGKLFYERQRHDDAARSRLETTSDRIANLVQTLPPKDFRAQFAVATRSTYEELHDIAPRALRDEVEAADLAALIRGLLRQIAELARVYDGGPLNGDRPAVYAANVMLFVATGDDPAQPFPDAIVGCLRFTNPDQDLSTLRGVLWMRASLFATNASVFEANVRDLALPVTREPKRHDRWTVLPGGPLAFVTDEVDGYADTHTLAAFCAERGDFLASVRDELHRYFTEGPATSVRSFISRPLVFREQHLGVLNIHSDCVNLLGPAPERREIFQALLTPLLLELAQAVEFYCRLDAETRLVRGE